VPSQSQAKHVVTRLASPYDTMVVWPINKCRQGSKTNKSSCEFGRSGHLVGLKSILVRIYLARHRSTSLPGLIGESLLDVTSSR
jgi:hypothetical protein